MLKKVILVGILLIFHCGIINAEVWVQTLQGDFRAGNMKDVTLSEIPGGRYINIADASIKLAGKSPVWYRDTWQVSDVDYYLCPHLMDFDGDGDYDILMGQRTKGGKIYIVENIGTKWQPGWKTKEIWQFNLSDKNVITVPYHADLDGDKDLDLLIGIVITEPEWTIDVWAYENIGSSTTYQWVRKPEWDPPDRSDIDKLFAIQPSLVDLDGDGDYDLFLSPISVDDYWFFYISTSTTYENIGGTSSPVWIKNEEWNLDKRNSHLYLNFSDMDSDRDIDIFLGAAEGYIGGFKNIGSSTFPVWKEINEWNIHDFKYGSNLYFENPSVTIADLDNDGNIDIIVGNQEAGYCLTYENTNFFINDKLIWKQRSPWDTSFVDESCSVTIADLTFDGRLDMILTETEILSPSAKHGMGYVYENIGEKSDALSIWSRRKDLNLEILTTLNNGQGIFYSKPVFVDINNAELLRFLESCQYRFNGFAHFPLLVAPD